MDVQPEATSVFISLRITTAISAKNPAAAAAIPTYMVSRNGIMENAVKLFAHVRTSFLKE